MTELKITLRYFLHPPSLDMHFIELEGFERFIGRVDISDDKLWFQHFGGDSSATPSPVLIFVRGNTPIKEVMHCINEAQSHFREMLDKHPHCTRILAEVYRKEREDLERQVDEVLSSNRSHMGKES